MLLLNCQPRYATLELGQLESLLWTERVSLSEIMFELNEVEKYDLTIDTIDLYYDRVVNILQYSSDMTVPRYHKNFKKNWLDQELDELKEMSIVSCTLWREAGRPMQVRPNI